MGHGRRFSILIAFALGLAACTQETPPPAPAPKPQVEAPAQRSAAPAQSPGSALVPGTSIPSDVVSVAFVTLGNALTADQRLQAPTDLFEKHDTIYAIVDTMGSGTATLKAKWTYHEGGQVTEVSESMQTIQPTGRAASAFHISHPDGWPAGDYQIEILVDDKPVGTRKFKVK